MDSGIGGARVERGCCSTVEDRRGLDHGEEHDESAKKDGEDLHGVGCGSKLAS